jgi:hypothetical protein
VSIISRLVLTIAIVIAVLGTAASAAASSLGASRSSADDGVAIAFVDDRGEPLTTPTVNITGAFPGMPRHVSTFTIHNRSDVAAAYTVSAGVTQAPDEGSLADVLVVTVTVASDASRVYRGPLSELRLDGMTVAGGGRARHRMTIEWPDGGPSDNRFQGQAVRFDLQATARAAT